MGLEKGNLLLKNKRVKAKWFFALLFIFIFLGGFYLIIVLFTMPILSLYEVIAVFFLLFLSVLSIFFLIYYNIRFLKIYENGIVFRRQKSITFLIAKYIPFEEITDAEITKEKRKPIDRKTYRTVSFLQILSKNVEPIKIDHRLATNYRKALNLIKKYKKG